MNPGQMGQSKVYRRNVQMYIGNHWEPVSELTSRSRKPHTKEYIDYTQVIEEERIRSLFPNPKHDVFAGGMYTYMPGNEGRYVYFEGSDPARPVMRVAKTSDDDERVRVSYPWDRVNFVYKEMGRHSYMCYIYTPANLNSYGLVVDKEEVYFKRTANGGFKEELTLFQIELTPQHTTIIKAVNEGVGLYIVDTSDDGYKVKATRDRGKWNTFVIIKFLPQTPTDSENTPYWPNLHGCTCAEVRMMSQS